MGKRCNTLLAVVLTGMVCSGCQQIWDTGVGNGGLQRTAAAADIQALPAEITSADTKCGDAAAREVRLDTAAGETRPWYTVEGDILSIVEEGAYVLRGKWNGGIRVSVYDDELVHLILDNAEIENDKGPAVLVENADKVVITLAEGTQNTLSDGAGYDGEAEACLYSVADLTINGHGKLHVYGYRHDAIRSKDCLKIVESDVSVRAKNNGIRGNDGVIIKDSQVEVESEGTGIVSKGGRDYVILEGGRCQVTSGENAISADVYVAASACELQLYAVMETIRCGGIKEVDEGYR